MTEEQFKHIHEQMKDADSLLKKIYSYEDMIEMLENFQSKLENNSKSININIDSPQMGYPPITIFSNRRHTDEQTKWHTKQIGKILNTRIEDYKITLADLMKEFHNLKIDLDTISSKASDS